jgi:endonuclease/exonuclease/phosphatase (EEP) superfamily protein YafD
MSPITCRVLKTASWIYLASLLTWLILNFLSADRFIAVSLLGFLAVYLFFPLLLVLIVVIACRDRWLGLAFMAGSVVFIWLWGTQFLPPSTQDPGDQPVLKVMTYNVLAWHNHIKPIIDNIQEEDPDIVFIQEMNTDLAEVLEKEMHQVYPYQVLEPADNPSGIGVISKHPITPTSDQLPSRWIGDPQVLEMEWEGRRFTIVNIHMFSTTGIFPLDQARLSFRLRDQQAQLLADLARKTDSLIVAGDANSSDTSYAYRILTGELSDAFRQAGSGLGHTFPGSDIPESDRPHIGGWYVPRWLARIDYVFTSADWKAISAHTVNFDGVSDHRGVIVELIHTN